MSAVSTSTTFFLSGINHCEVRPGQQLTLDHLRALQHQLSENARALQQLHQQAQQQGMRAAQQAPVAVKTEPASQPPVKKEDDGGQAQGQQTQQQQQAKLQYAALLALQLQEQQRRAAAAQAQAQGQAVQAGQQRAAAGAPAGSTPYGAAQAALAHNVYQQQGVAAGRMAGVSQQGRGGGRGGGAAGRQQKQQQKAQAAAAADADGEEAGTDQWVQCSKCQTWRQVPDEFWPDIENADEDEDWTCKDALWDVEDYEPHTAACC